MEEPEIREHIQALGKKSDEFLVALLDSGSYCWGDKYGGCENIIPHDRASDVWGSVLKNCLNFEHDRGLDACSERTGTYGVLSKELGVKIIELLTKEEYIKYYEWGAKTYGESEFEFRLKPLIPEGMTISRWMNITLSEARHIYTGRDYYINSKKRALDFAKFAISKKVLYFAGPERLNKEDEEYLLWVLVFEWQCEFDALNKCFHSYVNQRYRAEWVDFLAGKLPGEKHSFGIVDMDSFKSSVELDYGFNSLRQTEFWYDEE